MNVYESITNKIVASLEAGVIPWRKEWAVLGGAMPYNYSTEKPYRGINTLTLLMSGYASAQWLTYKQAKEIGAQVRKGEHGQTIVFWSFTKRENKSTGEEYESAFAKQYTVFNVEQIDGLPVSLPFDLPPFNPIDEAEAIVDGYMQSESHPTLAHGGGEAYYKPSTDHVQVPHRETFTSPGAYYATLFHELAHSTSIPSRLNRRAEKPHAFGDENYSKEELTAEFTSAFLCAESGITNDERLANSAAYIQCWIRALKNDKTLAIAAAQRAQKAADYILQRKAAAAAIDAEVAA
jgi:antirestriction protein ArdC